MAVTLLCGFEARDSVPGASTSVDLGSVGTASVSTAQARTGAASLRCNPASGATGWVGFTPGGNWLHFGLYITTLPSLSRSVIGSVSDHNVTLNSDGTLTVRNTTTVIGTSSIALVTGRWYWIAMNMGAVTSAALVQIDGVDAITGTLIATTITSIGFVDTEASAADIFVDDIIVDSAGFLPPSRVNLLIPTADSAKGTGWTNDAAATTNLFDAVNNEPPVGITDTTVGSGLHQLRNATANANVNYDATMTTYAAAGLTPQDTVLAVQPVIATAAPVTTSSKQGTVGVVSNPTITNVALGAGGTAGAFWSGVAAGTYPTGWKASVGTLTTSPTVTIATAPVMRVTQVTSSTRIAMVSFMGIYVAWTPGALGVIDEPGVFPGRGPRNVNQGINRASSY